MKLSDQILRKPFYVAFGQALQGGGITSVDLVATRDATTVTMTASDGSAAPIAGADASTAGVMTATDKAKLDGLSDATTQDFSTRLDVAAAVIGAETTHLRTAGHSAAGDNGAAHYKRVASPPSHALKVQSADGAWWEIVPTNNIIPFQACGGIAGNSATNGAANVTAFDDFIGYAQTFNSSGAIVSGPVLLFPLGHYHFNNHLNVKAAVILRGSGTFNGGVRLGSILEFAANKNGIIVHSATTIDETIEVSSFQANGTIIENLQVTGGGASGTTGHGIWMRAVAKVRNCRVEGFGLDGVHIAATVGGGGATEGNANQWALEDVSAADNGRHGVYVDLNDVNAGAGLRVDATSNGRWGIFDSSFLGNTWLGCHVTNNGVATVGGNASGESSFVSFGNNRYSANVGATEAQLVATTPGTNESIWIFSQLAAGSSATVPLWTAAKPVGTYFHGGAYHTDNINAPTAFIGCYREGNQGENQILAPAGVFFGLMGSNKGNGFAMLGNTGGATIVGSTTFSNDKSFFEVATRTLELDVNIAHTKLLRARISGSDFMGLVGWEEVDDTFIIGEWNNSGTLRPIRITAGTTTLDGGRASPLGGGQLVFGQGFFLGDSRTNARHQTNGTAAPSTGEHARGEIVWNRNTAAGAPLGWVCVIAGTPGTWVEIRGVGTQTSGANQAALTNSTGGTGDGTLVAIGDTSTVNEGTNINNNFTEIHMLLDEMRTTLVNFGLMKGSV